MILLNLATAFREGGNNGFLKIWVGIHGGDEIYDDLVVGVTVYWDHLPAWVGLGT